MRRFSWIGLLFLLALAACDTTTHEARRMVKRAERLADTLPDSTARLIDSVLHMPVSFGERERMDMALLQAEALFGCRGGSRNGSTISPVMDDDFFDDHEGNISTSPELERAAAYYGKKKQYTKAAHAALYSGFVQQHYNEKETAMRSFKDAEQYGRLAFDSLTVAQAEYKIGKMFLEDGLEQEAIPMLQSAIFGFDNSFANKALALNMMGVCLMLQGNFHDTEICLQQSLFNAERGCSDKARRKVLNNYAVFYRLQKKTNLAISCLRQIDNGEDLDGNRLLLLDMNLGDIYNEINDTDSASFYYKQIESILPEANVRMETKVAAYKSLSNFAESQGNFMLALQYWKQYSYWINEIRDRREQNNLYAIQKKYDFGILQNIMNQKTILRLRIIIVLSILAAVVLLAFAISQIRLVRIKKQEAEIKSSLLRFMRQNEQLAKQSEAYKQAHLDLKQKNQETEETCHNLASQAEKYRSAYEASNTKLSKAMLKEQQIMQKMAVYLGNKEETALFESLKYTVFGNQGYWDAMLKTFDKQFPDLRKELVLQHPDLTETEQKILLLSYVDASREDTALLLNISIFMVDKLRTSVKKKMTKGISLPAKNGIK